jgi:hypothetical protein
MLLPCVLYLLALSIHAVPIGLFLPVIEGEVSCAVLYWGDRVARVPNAEAIPIDVIAD